MQPAWSQSRTGVSAAPSKVGSNERRRILISMGGPSPAGKDARGRSAQPAQLAEQGCGKRRRLLSGLMRPHRIQKLAELIPGVGPTQNVGPGLARQSIEGGTLPVLFERREQIEQRQRLGLAGDGDAAGDPTDALGGAARCDLNDGFS